MVPERPYLAIIAVVGVLLVIVGLGVVAVASGYITDPDKPLQVELHYPTPLPTLTPTPYIPVLSDQVARLGEKADALGTSADRTFQSTTDAFTVSHFAGHDAVGAVGNALTIPACPPLSTPGYPSFRYAIAWPAALPEPATVLLDGVSDWKASFVFQETQVTATDPWIPYILDIGGTNYNLMVTRVRHNCQLLEGHVWTLHN